MSQSTFDISVLNGLGGDPSVKITNKRSHIHLLFDLGDTRNLTHKEVVKIRDMFISHCHMDHFMDFDRIIRINVPLKRPLRLFGPTGMIDQVSNRMRSYTWNLISSDQLPIIVHEIDSTRKIMRRAEVSKKNNFFVKQIDEIDLLNHTILKLADGSEVKAIALDHNGIDSLAYQVQYPAQYQIDMNKVHALNLKAGPWLRELQVLAKEQKFHESIVTGQKTHRVDELLRLITRKKPSDCVTYITDIGFSAENLKKLEDSFAKNSTLICESSFSYTEKDRATSKAHLTSKQAAFIAKKLQAKQFIVFHVSNLYSGREHEIAEEAYQTFNELKQIPEDQFKLDLEKELSSQI